MNPGSAEGHRDLGQVLVEAGKFHEAIPHLEQARSLTPDSSQINYPLGVALAATGRLDEAIARFESCLAAPAGTVDPGNIHIDIGFALLATGRSDEAIAHFEKAVSSTSALRCSRREDPMRQSPISKRRSRRPLAPPMRTTASVQRFIRRAAMLRPPWNTGEPRWPSSQIT